MTDDSAPRVAILLNPHAGGADPSALEERLEGRPGWAIERTESGAHAAELAERFAAAGCELVVAAGGDGTVRQVAEALAGTSAALGVLPLGTANDFARTLGLPAGLDALDALDEPELVPLDLLEVGFADGSEALLANVANGGFAGAVGEAITDEQKDRWGALAYGLAAISASDDVYPYALHVDGEPAERGEAVVIAIANARFCGGGVQIAPTADIEDGLLDVITVTPASPARLGALLAQLRAGRVVDHDLVERHVAREVRLEVEGDLPWSLDGELDERAIRRVQVRAGALRVAVGPDYRRPDGC